VKKRSSLQQQPHSGKRNKMTIKIFATIIIENGSDHGKFIVLVDPDKDEAILSFLSFKTQKDSALVQHPQCLLQICRETDLDYNLCKKNVHGGGEYYLFSTKGLELEGRSTTFGAYSPEEISPFEKEIKEFFQVEKFFA